MPDNLQNDLYPLDFSDKKKQLYFIHVQGYAVNTNTKYYVKERTTSF